MCKAIGCSPDYILDMSYENFLMYGYSTPTYDPDEDDKKDWDESKDMNNPENNPIKNGKEEFVF